MMRKTALIVLLLAAVSSFGAVTKHQYILVMKPGKNAPSDDDLTRGGGRVDFKLRDRVVITIPDAAIEGLQRHPSTKYLQRVVDDLGDAPQFAVMAAASVSTLQPRPMQAPPIWASGIYRYDGSGNIIGNCVLTFGVCTSWLNTYVYDAESRLVSSSVPGHTESYSYDAFGNMTSRTTDALATAIGIDPTTNRVTQTTTSSTANVAYDVAGNMSSLGNEYYFYDAGTQRSKIDAMGAQALYAYDANDERVGVQQDYSWIWSIRRPDGQVLRQYKSDFYSPSAPWLWIEDYVYRGGQLLAAEKQAEEGGRRHFHLDHLGTPRVITGAGGLQVSAHDYYPFGIEYSSILQEKNGNFDREEPRKFTGHERDLSRTNFGENTSYIDYMHARYYNPNLGRFLSVDPVLDIDSAMRSPQGWNRYSYVRNNPINAIDPDGRYEVPAWLSSIGSAGAGFIPIAGEIQDAGIALTGYDYMNLAEGQAGWGTRAISAAAFLVPLVGGKAISEGIEQATRVHKNSLQYVGDSHVYRINGPDGKV